jgi:hypothetical protein
MRIKASRDAGYRVSERDIPIMFEKKRFQHNLTKKKASPKEYLIEFDPSLNLEE